MSRTPPESKARALNPKLPRSEPHDSWEGAVRAGQAGPETDGLPVAVMRTDQTLHPVQANAAWHALTAGGEIAADGADWLMLFEGQDQGRVRECLRRVLSTQHPMSLEVRGGSDDQWLEVRVAPDEWRSGVYVVALDISEQKRRETLLNFHAIHDPLTGLYNRVALLDHTRMAMARLRRKSSILAVLYIDLDHFKEINDRYGHETGDRVLAQAAERLQKAVRPSDLLARVGGDEFVAVFESFETEAEVGGVARRLVGSINEPMRATEAAEIRLGAAVGVVFANDPAESASSLIGRADAAMYRAKAEGGNLVRVDGLAIEAEDSASPDVAASKAADRLAGIEGKLLQEWAHFTSTQDGSATGHLRSASHHLARAITVLRDPDPAPSLPRDAKGEPPAPPDPDLPSG